MRDSQAAKALLVRRLKCLSNYEGANRALEKARHRNKDIHAVRKQKFVVNSNNALKTFLCFALKAPEIQEVCD